tara:strand:- start:4002 stop:4379 length:378 start_codon:yes stop_codon:yes gene_type:complete
LESTEDAGWLNNRIGDLFYLLHIWITVFCAFAWLGPFEWMWWGVFILYGATEILWLLRDEYCIITDIERYFRGIPRPETPLDQNFIRRLIATIFRIDISPENSRMLTRVWGRLGWLIATLRLFVI